MVTTEKKTKLWAFTSQLLTIFSGTILLFLLLRALTRERYAVWVAFTALAAFSLFLEQALEPALTRYAAYAFAGAFDLPMYGQRPSQGDGVLNTIDVARILQVGRKLYASVTLLVAILVGTLGTLLLAHLTSTVPGLKVEALTAWGFYFSGILVSVRWGYLNPTLMGLGEVSASYQAIAYSRGTFLLITAGGVLATRSLVPIGIAYLAWAVVLRAYSAARLQRVLPDLPKIAPDPMLFKAITDGSWRMGVSQLGAFFALKMNYLLVTYFLGLRTAAAYGLSLQAVETITLLALTPIQYRLPQLIALRTTKAMSEFRNLVGRVSTGAWLISLLGMTGLIMLGPMLLRFLSSQSNLLPTSMLVIMCCTAFLATNHSLFVILLLADNSVPFMWASLISGLVIVILATSYLALHTGGILGILLIEMGVQLSYNNWKWPLEGARRFEMGLGTLLRQRMRIKNSPNS